MALLAKRGSIGKLNLKNRILMAPMGTHNGNMDEGTLAYFKTRLAGGAAMVLCNMMVSDKFEDTSASMTLNDENIGNFKEMCDYAHEQGAAVCAQLMPGCGRTGGPSPLYGVPISASSCPWLYAPQVPCHELTLEEIQILLDDFRATAKRAVDAGADAIEIHAYGGYLTDQFLSGMWNTRTDAYGGSLEGRMKFLLDMVQISKEVGGADFPVIVKYSPTHCLPVEYGFRGIDEGIEMAKILEKAGVDALHVDAGCYESWHNAMPPTYFQEMTPQMDAARKVRQTVSIPVITHGRLNNVAKAEAALETGICDFVAIGRGLLADPELPNKVLEGRTEDIRPCISCNEGCIAQVCVGKAVGCAVNPLCAKENVRKLTPAQEPKKILVVGAGPAGCAAALMAKQNGHTVEIWEKQDRVGGRVLAAAAPYMKQDMIALVEYYHTQLVKAQIPVQFMKCADAESIAAYAPDAVIWAAGGKALLPASIPGLDQPHVCTAEDALRNLRILGNTLVIVGGGLVGIEAALHYARMGKAVTVVEMADTMLPKPPFAMNKMQLEGMLQTSGIELLPKTKLVEVKADCVVVESEGETKEISCDTVLMAMGTTPTEETAKALESICPVYCIGESAHGAADILTGVEDAYQIVSKL